MAKLKVLIVLSFFMTITLQAQKLNKKIMDTKTQKEILTGKCNLKGLKTGEFGESFNVEYNNYISDTATIALLHSKTKNITFEIVLGTWCGDSKEQVPRFIKILDDLKFKIQKVSFICVNRTFVANGFDKKKSNVLKVPTFIIYRKNKEIGRIVETPVMSLEKDLFEILSKSKN